ncbi:tRNA (guanine(46)-N(7))-methyltransferase TrmB [Nannocystaceae bacterium ST9]
MASRVPQGQLGARLDQVARRVRRHLAEPWRHPIADHQRAVFDELSAWRAALPRDAIVDLDAGCGTGASTLALARAKPDAWVLGVDKSSDRLARSPSSSSRVEPGRTKLLRGDMIDLWHLLDLHAGPRFDTTWLLYPNPWPKPGQLARRWHAHPVFPRILACTRRIELRTNWRIYAEEFAHALALVLGRPVAVEELVPDVPLSPFERKYQASGHALWRVAGETG